MFDKKAGSMKVTRTMYVAEFIYDEPKLMRATVVETDKQFRVESKGRESLVGRGIYGTIIPKDNHSWATFLAFATVDEAIAWLQDKCDKAITKHQDKIQSIRSAAGELKKHRNGDK